MPIRGNLSYEEIVTSIFNFIGDSRYLDDVMSIRKLNEELRATNSQLIFLGGP